MPSNDSERRNPRMYKITITVYTNCGRDFTKSEPIEISYEGSDIDELKKCINSTILNAMRAFNANDGLTRIEYTIEENGVYVDHEVGYYNIDLANNTAKFVID
jgi:hypothetical protein